MESARIVHWSRSDEFGRVSRKGNTLQQCSTKKKTLLVLFEKTQFPPRLVDGRPCQPWTMSCYIGARTIAASIASIVDFE